MKQKRKHVLAGMLLSAAVFLCIPMIIDASAAEVTITGYAEKDDLLTKFNLTKENPNIGKIKFGKDIKSGKVKEWYIAGQDGKDTLALLSASSFGYSEFNGVESGNIYGDDNKPTKKSIIKKFLESCETKNFFSDSELDLMKETSVVTKDNNNYDRTVTGRLYLAGAKDNMSFGADTIYLGSGNDIPVFLNNLGSSSFWLRTPYEKTSGDKGVVFFITGILVNTAQIGLSQSVRPAMNLDVSSVLFASAASAETEGSFENSEAMTLRFPPVSGKAVGSVLRKGNDGAIKVSDVANDAYVVVQNSDGAWAKKVSKEQLILPEEVKIGNKTLTSFKDCKVWIESTNAERITTAVNAVNGTSSISITAGANSNMTLRSGNPSQIDLYGEMDDVIYEAKEGYYFPQDYADGIGNKNGVTVIRKNTRQIMLSGAPWDNTTITLPDASPLKQPAIPKAMKTYYNPNTTLYSIKIPKVEGGSWNWDNETIVPSVKRTLYPATFTPSADSEYREYHTNVTLNIERTTPRVDMVMGRGTYGDKLSEFVFLGSAISVGGKVEGTFQWNDKEIYPQIGDTSLYSFEFIPDDKDNYNNASGFANVTVHKKPVSITINDAEKLYGDANPKFSFKVTSGSMVGDDTIEDLAVKLECNADEKTAAGTKVDIIGSYTSEKYDVTIKPGTLNVKKRPIHIKVADKKIKSNQAFPTNYDYTLTNLVNGDDEESIGITLKIEPEKLPAVAGNYALKVTDWSIKDSNYTKGEIQEGFLTIFEDEIDNKENTNITEEIHVGDTTMTNQVNTGDTTSIMGLSAMAIISAMLIIAIISKKKQEEKTHK